MAFEKPQSPRSALVKERGFQAQLQQAQRADVSDEEGGGTLEEQNAESAAEDREEAMQARLQQAREAKRKKEELKSAATLAAGGTAGLAKEAAKGALKQQADSSLKIATSAFIKVMWSTCWLTFGHTIYVIDLMFFFGYIARKAMGWDAIPEVGEEWLPKVPGIELVQKRAVFTLKLAEFPAIFLITGLVVLIDFIILTVIAFMVSGIKGLFS